MPVQLLYLTQLGILGCVWNGIRWSVALKYLVYVSEVHQNILYILFIVKCLSCGFELCDTSQSLISIST